jgi:hypothetical protein
VAYRLVVPGPMRIFLPVGQGTKLMRPSGRVAHTRDVVRISGMFIMSFDHDDKLALRLLEAEEYVLIQELEGCRGLSYKWSQAYEESVRGKTQKFKEQAKESMQEIEQMLAPLLRKHLRPELQLVGSHDPSLEGHNPRAYRVFW